MYKISIIIPVFNCESTILSCLASIVDQDWPEKEIIVVDDGSTDDSLKLCKEFAANHHDVIILNQNHAGPSSCRNLGIKVSTGTFISFCDADDKFSPNALSSMIRLFDESIDLVVGNVYKRNSPIISNSAQITKRDAISRFFRHDNGRILGSVYGKMYKKNLICPLNGPFLLFDENISVGEDALFLLHYMLRCRSIQLSANYLYIHKHNPNGTIASSQLTEFLSAFYASKMMIESVVDDPDLYNLAITDLCWVFVLILKRFSSIADAEVIKDRFKSIIESLRINLIFFNIPSLIIDSNNVSIEYVSYNWGHESGDKSISVDMANMGIMIMPSYVNMHIHLEDYCDKPIGVFNSTEDFLLHKVINTTVRDNIARNLILCEREGCLTVGYTHNSNINHNTVSILHQSKSPSSLNENGWMLNNILSYTYEQIISVFSLAKKYRKPIFFHLSSSRASDQKERLRYNGSFITFLANEDLLSEFCYIVHGSYLDAQELTQISKYRANIVICPIAEKKANECTLCVDELCSRGITWMMGTDSQALAGSSSVLENAVFLLKQQHCIDPNVLLHSISVRPVESSSKWAHPLTQKNIIIDVGQTPIKQMKAIDFLLNKFKPICQINIKSRHDA